MKSKSKKKYAYGGTAMNLDSPSEGLSKIRKTTEDALYGAMIDPTVLGLKGLGSMMTNTGMSMVSQGFGQAGDMSGIGGFLQDNMSEISKLVGTANMASVMATGGSVSNKVPINAEGGEVLDTPFGLPIELMGPSHANGGIDLNVPAGTDVYSKRLKGPDGKTMADRKKSREKKAAQLAKIVEENPSDKLAKATLAKVESNNEIIDTQDVAKMDFVRNMSSNKFATGGTVGPGPTIQIPAWLQNIILNNGTTPEFGNSGKPTEIQEVVLSPTSRRAVNTQLAGPILNTGTVEAPQINPVNYTAPASTVNKTVGTGSVDNMGITLGDAIGMGGNLISTFGPIINTIKNREGDTPNINAYENYGLAGLNKLRQSEQYVDQVRDNKLQDLELSRQGTINRNNASARGINTLRALNLVTDAMANNTETEIYNQFAQAMQGIFSQEASMLNDRDVKVMQGEYMRDLADRQDRDAFFTNLGKDISTMGTGLQVTGKNLNAMKTRGVTNNLLNQMYNQFGVDAMTGEIKAKATEEINNNPAFYNTASKAALDGILAGQYVRRGNSLYDREGNQLDPKTLQIITPATDKDKYKLNVDVSSIYDQFSPFNIGQA